jgi:5,10-methylenetetrahydromethanopterin reductase
MGAEPVRTSLRLNNDVAVDELVELAAAAEDLGFDQLWVSNDLFFRSAPVLLAAAFGATHRISLGTCVLNPYSVHPAEIAMAAATLQELSGGRFLLGLAAGAEDFLAWAGIARPAPVARTREAVVAVRALCQGQAPADVDGSGEHWQAEARLRVPSAPVPIYLGAMSPRMLALIGEVADGGLPLLYPPESYGEAAAHIARGLDGAGRRADDVDIAACIWVSVDEDPGRAQRPLAEKLAYYGASFAPHTLARVGVEPAALAGLRDLDPDGAVAALPPAMLSLGVAGAPDDVVARCRALLDAGARHVSFGPPLGPDPLTAVNLLGGRVLPALRSMRGPLADPPNVR